MSTSPASRDVDAPPSAETVSITVLPLTVRRNKSSALAWKDTVPLVGAIRYPSSRTLVGETSNNVVAEGGGGAKDVSVYALQRFNIVQGHLVHTAVRLHL